MGFRDYAVLVFGAAAFFVGGPAVMVLLSMLGPEDFLPDIGLTLVISAVSCAFGIFFCAWAVKEMISMGKGGPAVLGPLKLNPETKFLVTTGPYKLTRNPMHLGIILYLLGFACFLNSLWSLAVPLLMLIFAFVLAVFVDEPRLKRDFGAQYESYKAAVPRFLPQIKKRF